jgi:hypothetical protein
MSKRARGKYERNPRDCYRTPRKAVLPLLAYLPPRTRFIEPCAGAGDLVDHLEADGHICAAAFDTEPQRGDIELRDAMTLHAVGPDIVFITNLPWTREWLHPLIAHLSDLAPLWTLLDSDWAFTAQAESFMGRCDTIVSVGRERWIAGTKNDGFDNAAWYRFDCRHSGGAQFHTKHRAGASRGVIPIKLGGTAMTEKAKLELVTPTPSDALDIEALWEDPTLGDGLTDTNLQGIAVDKPKDFFRVHPDSAYRRRCEV